MKTRRGFTLVELLMALVLTVAVGGLVYKVLVTTQRVSRGQSATASMQSNVRAGALIVPNDLREIGFDTVVVWDPLLGPAPNSSPDLIEIAPTRVRFRAMRGFSTVCQFDMLNQYVYVQKPWLGFRDPVVQDSFRLFVESDENTARDDEWMPITVLAVDPHQTCKGQPAFRLRVLAGQSPLVPGALPAASRLKDGGPIRAWEEMEFGLYQSSGWWLGARSIGHGEQQFQPVLGPLRATDGITLTYKDKNDDVVSTVGNTIANRRAVRSIQLLIRGETDQQVTLSGRSQAIGTMDLTTRVALRNALRP